MDKLLGALPLIIGVVIAVISGVFLIRNRIGGERFARKNPLPPTWPEMWERMELQDKKIAALARMLGTAADQWPANTPGPVFDADDLATLEDTMPARWRFPAARPPREATP